MVHALTVQTAQSASGLQAGRHLKLAPNPTHHTDPALLYPAGAVQLRNSITERFGVELPATAALDFPTVLALAGFVAQSVAPAAAAEGALASADAFGAEWDAWSDYSGDMAAPSWL